MKIGHGNMWTYDKRDLQMVFDYSIFLGAKIYRERERGREQKEKSDGKSEKTCCIFGCQCPKSTNIVQLTVKRWLSLHPIRSNKHPDVDVNQIPMVAFVWFQSSTSTSLLVTCSCRNFDEVLAIDPLKSDFSLGYVVLEGSRFAEHL